MEELMVRIHPGCPNKDPICPPAKEGDVGFDLRVWIEDGGTFAIKPQQMSNIRTGVFIKLPNNCWGNIRPRSSTFAKHELFIMGGTIDSGYTGELSIYTWNPTNNTVIVNNGDRLAQLIICPRIVPKILLIDDLPHTQRGSTGFGSTDV